MYCFATDTTRAQGGGSDAVTEGCMQELDGIVMVIDPQHPEQEKELETFYMNFAQPNSLTIKQCLVLAIQVVKEGSYGLVGWNGE